jgi:hypothetical protein
MEMSMDYPKTRQEAKETGAKYYFTGEPCTRGHIALRKTKGVCIECMKVDWEAANLRRSEKPKSDAAKKAGRRYYEKNKDLVIAKANNQPKEQARGYKKAWKERNPDYAQVSVSMRRRRLRNATPKWLTPDHKNQIREMYLAARELTRRTKVKHVVDHIIPLRSEVVCGLHVPWNLQIMTHNDNCAKSNKMDEMA